MREDRSAAYAAFVLRISLAYFFAAHLYVKFAILGVDAWWSSLEKAGYAAWVPYYTVAAEFAGAILLLLGIYSRYVALLALPVLIAVTRHWAIRKGLWFVDGGAEFPLAWTLMLVVQAILGDGAFAVKVPAPPWERRPAAMMAGE
ncbi:MAG TPA: DoxX family protein [Stellaceae bacterium]|nr:DoxX family protein [Stellaceae bacterium]